MYFSQVTSTAAWRLSCRQCHVVSLWVIDKGSSRLHLEKVNSGYWRVGQYRHSILSISDTGVRYRYHGISLQYLSILISVLRSQRLLLSSAKKMRNVGKYFAKLTLRFFVLPDLRAIRKKNSSWRKRTVFSWDYHNIIASITHTYQNGFRSIRKCKVFFVFADHCWKFLNPVNWNIPFAPAVSSEQRLQGSAGE